MLNMIGPNELTPAPTDPAWKLFLRELFAPLNLMLIIAAALCILVSQLENCCTNFVRCVWFSYRLMVTVVTPATISHVHLWESNS